MFAPIIKQPTNSRQIKRVTPIILAIFFRRRGKRIGIKNRRVHLLCSSRINRDWSHILHWIGNGLDLQNLVCGEKKANAAKGLESATIKGLG